MSMPLNIVGQTSQPTTTGQGGVAGSQSISSDEFKSLFATLLALTTPTTETGQTPVAQTGITTANTDIAGFNLSLEAATGETGDAETLQDILAKILGELEASAEELLNNGEIDPALREAIAAVLNELTALQSSLTQTATSLTQTATSTASQLGSATQNTPAVPLLNTENTPKAGDAPTEPANKNAEQLALKLAELAQKLSSTQPDLASKLQDLTQKFAELASRTPNQPAITEQLARASDPEVANTLSALFGNRQSAQSKTANGAPTSEQTLTDIEAAKLDTPGTAASKTTNTGMPGQNEEGGAKTARPSANGNTSASATLAASAAQAEPGAQTDPLLLAQTTAQTGAKSDFAAALKPMTAAYQQPTPHINLPHIAVEMARNITSGATRFQIRLDPPEMGRIDVKLDVDRNGTTTARLTVERADTLDLLQRDSRALERALSQAGLDGARTNLEFSLKQNPFARQDGQTADNQNGQDPSFTDDDPSNDDTLADVPGTLIYRGTASPGGVNLFA